VAEAGWADGGPGGATSPPRFPDLAVRSLAGDELLLPRDLTASLTLVLLAFRQWQQGLVDEWIAWAVDDAAVAPTPLGLDPGARAVVVEVPVIGRRYRPARRVIDGGMAASIRVPAVLARTLTAYTDVSAFCRAAGISSTETVHALVVRRDGVVLAHAAGTPDDANRATVLAALGTPRGHAG
jgi:hypothetical protein